MNALLTCLARLFAAMPPAAAMRCGRALGWFTARVVRPRRRYVLDTLAQRMPETTPADRQRIADNMYRGLACNIVEILGFAGGRRDEMLGGITLEGKSHVDEAMAKGRGALVLTAHIGNWDLSCMAAAMLVEYPLTIISKNLKNSGINRFWMRVRSGTGIRILPSRNSYRDCLKVLRRNELLGFIMDVNRPRSEAVFVDFFGIPAATTPGLAFLAAQSGAPVLPAFMHRTGPGRHVLIVKPALDPPANRKQDAIIEATQLYTKVIEDEIRRYPADWLWLHKRWKSRPQDE